MVLQREGKVKKDTKSEKNVKRPLSRFLAKDGMSEKDSIESPIPSDSAKAANLTANGINSAPCESYHTTAEKAPVSGLCTNPTMAETAASLSPTATLILSSTDEDQGF